MDLTKHGLVHLAHEARMQPHVLRGQQGGLIVTEHGARVLGCILDGVEENLFWVNPRALESAAAAREAVSAGAWNIGGDRFWLAPEQELHWIGDGESLDYSVPAGVDPGTFIASHAREDAIVLTGGGQVVNQRHGNPFEYRLVRGISLCEAPLAHPGARYVGYEISSELRVVQVDRPEAAYGLWHIVQVPAGGDAYIRARPDCPLLDYSNSDAPSRCRRIDGGLAMPIEAKRMHKIGVPATECCGLMGYVRAISATHSSLVVRRSTIFRGGLYVDYPAENRAQRDIALQVYDDDGGNGAYGELEYHVPAAYGGNHFQARDVSRLWCFAGETAHIKEIARELLYMDIV